MFERPDSGGFAVLVSLDFGNSDHAESLEELRLLVASAGLSGLAVIGGRRERPDAATFLGSGKLEQVREALRASGSRLVIFNHDLSGVQQRNLERALEARVLDRTELILYIFAQRARSHEGKLQVELARLEHQSTRLVRGWTHLERQKGGIGLRGGPGETQLEVDRRLLAKRVKVLKDRLARVKRQRGVQRHGRRRARVFHVALVGYTNTGKSTLFNRLTNAGAYTADRLFATLDTTTRKLFLPSGQSAVISDTVGFIRHLPHSLVAAFRATLEETAEADLLLHMVDAANPERAQQIEEVNHVLAEIGAQDVPQILVMNKIDLNQALAPGVALDEYGRIAAVRVSALTGAGIELIPGAIEAWCGQSAQQPAADECPDDEAMPCLEHG